MQLLQLRYFLTVARLEHMSKAAEALNISQSSLTRTIARLEQTIGVPLFDRVGKSIRLNAYGEHFAKEAEKALGILTDAHEYVLEMANLQADHVTVSVMTSTILPPIFKNFYTKRPNVKIRQSILPDVVAKEQLLNGEIELCISNTPILDERIEWLPVMKEKLDLIVPRTHRFASRESIQLKELQGERFIGYKSGLESSSMYEKICMQAGVTPNVVFEGTELSIVLQLVNEGEGISFYPQYAVIGDQLDNTKVIPIEDEHSYQMVGFAWLKNREYSYVATQFRQHMIKEFELIHKKYHT